MDHRRQADRPLFHLPALAAIARDPHPIVVIQKAAQVGLTELLVNQALWAADTAYAGRGNVLYLMPTQNLMDDFAQARFDRAIQDSAYLRGRLQPEPPARKGADSKRLKRIGPGYCFLRGADSRRQIASVDADLVILDEFDQMADGILPLAKKRLASSRAGRLYIASTPRFPEAGINALYRQSDQRHYHLPCPACGEEQPLTWDDNVDLARAVVVCRACRAAMNTAAVGRWVAAAPGNDQMHGYHLNRLYSPWLDLPTMIEASYGTTPAEIQEFQNSDLGEVFVPEGGGLTLDVLDRCRADYGVEDYAGQPCDMGVDVGKKLHVVIREHHFESVRIEGGTERRRKSAAPRLWWTGEVDGFAALDDLMQRFHVQVCVVDAQPELHAAPQFADRHPGKVWLAYYGRHDSGIDVRNGDWTSPATVHVNRTLAIDATFARFWDRTAVLPRDARRLVERPRREVGEYYRQLLALQRTLERDAQQNWVARWTETGRGDHFAHAEVYCWLADDIAARHAGAIFWVPGS